MFFRSIFCFCSLVSALWLWSFWIKEFKIALVTSFILLTISYFDCNAVLVWLVISYFDLSFYCRYLIWLLSVALGLTTKFSHLDLKDLNSLLSKFFMSPYKLFKISFLNLTICIRICIDSIALFKRIIIILISGYQANCEVGDWRYWI